MFAGYRAMPVNLLVLILWRLFQLGTCSVSVVNIIVHTGIQISGKGTT
jgi:hypothetical protein